MVRVVEDFGSQRGTLLYVADGHGYDGKKASHLVYKKLPRYLSRVGFDPGAERHAVRKVCHKLDVEIKRFCEGGTTLTLAFLSNNSSFVAWVGDSEAFRVNRNGFESLVAPHDFERKDEVHRLNSSNADLQYSKRSFMHPLRSPIRVICPQGRHKLNITRSLGDKSFDLAHHAVFGKSFPDLLPPEPEFRDIDLDGMSWLMIASDGVVNTLNETITHSSEYNFFYRDQSLGPSEAAERFRNLVQSKIPYDNSSVVLVRPHC